MRAVVGLWAMGCVAAPDAVVGSVDLPDDPPEPTEPSVRGPYEVGVVTRVVERETLLPLTLEIWYPASPEGPPEPDAVYHPTFRVPEDAVREAPPDLRESLPVVLFSHGFGGVRFQSAFLTEHLASHGFVVVAPDHPRNTLLGLYPDEAAEVAARRPGDVRDALDALLAGVDGLGLRDAVQGERVAVVGHSFGAITALVAGGGRFDPGHFEAHCADEGGRACAFVEDQGIPADVVALHGQPDPRVVAIVPLAPGGAYAFGPDGAGLATTVPSLVIAGTLDGDLPYETEARPVWEAMGSPTTLLTLEGAGHWGFTDLCGFLPLLDCAGQSEGFMEPDRVVDLTRAATTAFLRNELRGEDLTIEDAPDAGILSR